MIAHPPNAASPDSDAEFNPGRRTLSGTMLDAILRALYAAPSVLALTPVQDLFGWITRINLPGTVGGRNWSYRLPFNLRPFDAGPAIQARIERLKAIAVETGRFDLTPGPFPSWEGEQDMIVPSQKGKG